MEAAAKKGGDGMASAMAKMGAAVGGAVTGVAKSVQTATEPVDFRELKNLLPAGIGAMKRTSSEGEKGGGFGFVVSHAEARYEGDGRPRNGEDHRSGQPVRHGRNGRDVDEPRARQGNRYGL